MDDFKKFIYDNLEILKMFPQDLEIIKENLQNDFDEFWNYDVFKSELDNENSSYLIARVPKNLVCQFSNNIILDTKVNILGFAGIKKVLDEADIMNIVVRKDVRNIGIASLLLERLFVLASNLGCKSITLEVNEKNLNAIKLYQKYNFEIVGLRKKYYNGTDNAILMSKPVF